MCKKWCANDVGNHWTKILIGPFIRPMYTSPCGSNGNTTAGPPPSSPSTIVSADPFRWSLSLRLSSADIGSRQNAILLLVARDPLSSGDAQERRIIGWNRVRRLKIFEDVCTRTSGSDNNTVNDLVGTSATWNILGRNSHGATSNITVCIVHEHNRDYV